MADTRYLAPALAGLAALLALAALVTPWWTATSSSSVSGFAGFGGDGTYSNTASAGPFNDGGLADEGDTATAGVLVLLALIGAGLGVVGAVLATPSGRVAALIGCSAAALLLGLAALLALTTWAADGDLWASNSASGFGTSASQATYASVGWYLALAGTLGAAAAAVVGAITPLPRHDSRPAAA